MDSDNKNEVWNVTVNRNGKPLVCIGHNSLTGCYSYTDREEEVIRLAGENILAFIGSRDNVPFIEADEIA